MGKIIEDWMNDVFQWNQRPVMDLISITLYDDAILETILLITTILLTIMFGILAFLQKKHGINFLCMNEKGEIFFKMNITKKKK